MRPFCNLKGPHACRVSLATRARSGLTESSGIPKRARVKFNMLAGRRPGWMARAYSLDLRERVVSAVSAGQSCRSVAKTFMVSVASVVKWSQRHRAVGSPAALKMGGRALPRGAREGLGSGADRREARLDAAGSAQGAGRSRLGGQLLCALAFSPARRRDVQKKAFAPPSRIGRTSPGGVSGGRRVRRRSIRGGLSLSTRPGPKPT